MEAKEGRKTRKRLRSNRANKQPAMQKKTDFETAEYGDVERDTNLHEPAEAAENGRIH